MAAIDRRRLLFFAPLGIAAAGGAAFLAMLNGLQNGSFDPRGVPSPLVGKPVPEFSLPVLSLTDSGASADSGGVVTDADLRGFGRPVLLNFFASWCVPCVEEAPNLAALRGEGIPIIGIAYKDHPEATAQFIAQNGNPYARLAHDDAGRVAIDFGLYGVPETYVIDTHGIIHARYAGGISEDIARKAIRPLLRRLS
jgi:cytochrome c biogenesis protein CcmG/thiol:disulfide interchange protein DsbE